MKSLFIKNFRLDGVLLLSAFLLIYFLYLKTDSQTPQNLINQTADLTDFRDTSPSSASNQSDNSDCKNSSPFNPVSKSCAIESPKAQLESQNNNELISMSDGFTSRKALDVLDAVPGASIIAFKTANSCIKENLTLQELQVECDELQRLMPFTLADLIVDSKNGDPEASFLMAKNYLWRLSFSDKKIWPKLLGEFDTYIARVDETYRDEIKKMTQKADNIRSILNQSN